jgi:ubiquinone biosynthesis monooxygenase Coq7
MTISASARKLAEMIRVDHAGEHGAVRIYDGQKAVFDKIKGKENMAALVAHMAEQEQEHLAYFDALISQRDIRPTALSPLWDMAGFTLGAVTALMGEKAAMACTAAVETEIDAHYAAQLEALADSDDKADKALAKKIEKFRADEAEHKHTALENGAEDVPAYETMSRIIRFGCRVAIRASEKI